LLSLIILGKKARGMIRLLKRELLAGITVSIVALPLALAFGMQATGDSSGAIIGLYGAIITGFFAALFGGTPRQVTGPTGPITIIVTGIIAEYGLTYAFIAAFMGGLLQVAFGLFRLGNYIKFIPIPVVSGFMNGIAIIIIVSQIQYVAASSLVVVLTIIFMLIAMKWIKLIPPSLMALIIGTIAVIGLEKILPDIHITLPFIGDFIMFDTAERIGEIPKGLPQLHLPVVDMEILIKLIPPALSIAILGSIDSLLTSVVMDNLSGTKHNSNKELIGQGIGNTLAGLFGAMPGAGATVRSVVNMRSGGETALSAMIHSVALLSFMLVLGSLAGQIPLAVLAGILIITGFSMFDFESIKVLKHEPRSDAVAMITTMVLTVAIDLMVAVGVGIVMCALIFMKRMSEEGVKVESRQDNNVSIYTLEGPLYFGATDALVSKILADKNSSIVLEMEKVPVIDASGALTIVQINNQLKSRGQELYLTGLQRNVKVRLRKMKVFQSLGNNHRFKNIDDFLYFEQNGFRRKVDLKVSTK
jgi:sulfate permease, SulP family